MQSHERRLIEELFERLRQSTGQERDPEAERLIADEMRRTPGAAYAMAQTIIAQNQALDAAAARLEDREDERPGSFASRPMGVPHSRGSVPSFGQRTGFGGGGGGFLANAGQVAMGVAGGMLMADAARALFGGGEAQAAAGGAQEASGAAGLAEGNELSQDAGINDVSSAGALDAGSEGGGGGLFGWLFGGGGSQDTAGGAGEADAGTDLADSGGGWDGGDGGDWG